MSRLADHEPPPLTAEEGMEACGRLRSGRAPALDYLPPKAVKAAVIVEPEFFTRVFGTLLSENSFPK